MLDEVLLAVTKAGMLAYVVLGMASLGLKLTLDQILGPLRDARMVVGALVANFVVVPAVAIGAARWLPMEDSAGTAVILLGACAGAPFLPALAKLAKGDPGLAVGSMVLLMVLTVGYAPVVVPLVVEGATVSAWDIASSLIVLMLIPLVIGLLVRARYAEFAAEWEGRADQASTAGLALAIGASILVGWRDVLGSVGSWIFVGAAIVIVAGLAAGYLASVGRSAADRRVLSLAAAQRNISAALVIAASLDAEVVVRTLVAALVLPVALIVLAGEWGKRSEPTPVEA